jgi:hypothetical protein
MQHTTRGFTGMIALVCKHMLQLASIQAGCLVLSAEYGVEELI